MPASLINFAAQERLDLADAVSLAQDQPTALLSGVLGSLVSRATADQAMYVLHGFRATQATGSGNANPAANQLLVSPGTGVLAWRRDAGTPRFGVMADLDGTDQAAQFVDFTYQPGTVYRVWLRLNYAAAEQTDRTFWAAGDPGYEYSALTNSRLVATWEVQALADGASPGPEWLAVAKVTWTAPTTQGGVGSLTGLTDTRPLFFEGRADATPAFAPEWGAGSNDRSADRGAYGLSDLRTALAALRTCLEDIKGPGLRRWWDPGVGGLNVGFTPNTPVLGRVAVGDAGTYLQGRTAASPSAQLVGRQLTGNAAFDGFVFAADRQTWTCTATYPAPVVTVMSQYGTLGVGNLAPTDLAVSPGRALAEFVSSAQGQAALRVGARATNNAVPSLIDALLHVIAPDQSGNLAEVYFGRGGVQGPEQVIYKLGKGSNNDFHIYDNVNQVLFFDYAYASRALALNCGDFSLLDSTGGGAVLTYSASARLLTLAQPVTLSGALVANTTLRVGATSTFGGLATFNGSVNISGTVVSGAATAPSFTITNAPAKLASNRLIVGTSAGVPPSDTPYGTIYYDPTAGGGRFYCFTQASYDGNDRDDGLPRGWKRIQMG